MQKIIYSGLLFLILHPLIAQQPDSIKHYDLEEITVAATRMNLQLKDIPQKVEIIDQQVIKTVPAENLAELLKRTTNLDIVQYPGLYATIGMRGFSPSSHSRSYTLLLINGKPSGTINLATMNTSCIERIEVIKGPYSALYGSDAMGGVINIITKTGNTDKLGSLTTEAGSFGSYNINTELSTAIGQNTNFIAGYSRHEQLNDYGIGNYNLLKINNLERNILDKSSYKDTMLNTKFHINHLNAKMEYKLNNIWQIELEGLFSAAKGVELPGNYWGSYGTNKKDFNRINLYGNLKRRSEKSVFNFSPYYTREDNYDYNNDSDTGFVNFNSKIREYGFKLHNNFKIDKVNILVGADIDIHNAQSERFSAESTPTNPYTPDYKNTKTAIFAQLAYKHAGLFINAGARYDLIYYDIAKNSLLNGSGGNELYNAFNPSIGAQYTFPFNLKLHGSLGTAFSVPDAFKVAGYYAVSEYFEDWDFWWISNYKGNPDLKPESSITSDLGLSYNSKEKLFYLDMTYFQTDHKDKIVELMIEGDTTSYKNANRSEMNGLELITSANLGSLFNNSFKLELYANFTFNLKGTVDETIPDMTGNDSIVTRNMLYTRKSIGSFGIFFDNYKGFSTRLNVRYCGSRLEFDNFSLLRPDITSADYHKVGGYTTTESILEIPDFLIIDYSVFYTIKEKVRLGITISNLFNENYHEKDGYHMPGRMISGSIAYTFKKN